MDAEVIEGSPSYDPATMLSRCVEAKSNFLVHLFRCRSATLLENEALLKLWLSPLIAWVAVLLTCFLLR